MWLRQWQAWRTTLETGLRVGNRSAFAKHAWLAGHFNSTLVREEGWVSPIEIPGQQISFGRLISVVGEFLQRHLNRMSD